MLLRGEQQYRDRRHAPARRMGWQRAAWLAAVLTVAQPTASLSEEPDAKAGEKLYRGCKGCHEVGENARNKVGPHLVGIFGRTAGSLEDFKYSSAMRKAGKDGLVWDVESLSALIHKPRDFIKGNRMSYRGMAKAEDRANLIAYLQTAGTQTTTDGMQSDSSGSSEVDGLTETVLQIDGDQGYGEYLASECTTCHQESGAAESIPSIVGLPKDYFIRSLLEYKTDVRLNDVMKSRVENLANEELAALAEYFSSLTPQ